MIVSTSDSGIGVTVSNFDAAGASDEQIAEVLDLVYRRRIVVLRDQRLTPKQFVELGHRMGRPDVYYEPMYRHPEHEEIFVSSTVPTDGKQVGVPQTGKFWHADYQFMPRPFGITMTHPLQVPSSNRGTYYIDMTAAYRTLPAALRDTIDGTVAVQTAARYFKIRPSDVYRPICELQAEIEQRTPPVRTPTTFRHPVHGDPVLYVSEGMTCALERPDGTRLDDAVLREVLARTGQLDDSFGHENIHLQEFAAGDLLVWDNRSLVHRARHTASAEPAVSHRVTVHDGYPFYPGIPA